MKDRSLCRSMLYVIRALSLQHGSRNFNREILWRTDISEKGLKKGISRCNALCDRMCIPRWLTLFCVFPTFSYRSIFSIVLQRYKETVKNAKKRSCIPLTIYSCNLRYETLWHGGNREEGDECLRRLWYFLRSWITKFLW